MAKKLPKKLFARWRHYEGNDETALEANTETDELVDLQETCEIGIYELTQVVRAKNTTDIFDK